MATSRVTLRLSQEEASALKRLLDRPSQETYEENQDELEGILIAL